MTIEKKKIELEKKKVELEDIIQKTEKKIDGLEKKISKLNKQVDDRLLKAFDALRQRYGNGLAIVTITRNACGGCFNKIPPQRQLDIKTHKKIIVCEYCGRILVDAEMLGVDVPQIPSPAERPTIKAPAVSKDMPPVDFE